MPRVRIGPAKILLSAFTFLVIGCGESAVNPTAKPGAIQESASESNESPTGDKTTAEIPKEHGNSEIIPFSDVDRILAHLETANIAFNCPEKIHLNETAKIELLLSLKETVNELIQEVTAKGNKQGAHVKVSSQMEARLTGANFQISAISPEEQAVGTVDTVQWEWEVKPLATGRQQLHLTLTAVFKVDGTTTRRAIRTFDQKIDVEVQLQQTLTEFIAKNWQWLWAAILVPIAGLLWKRWRIAKRNQHTTSADTTAKDAAEAEQKKE